MSDMNEWREMKCDNKNCIFDEIATRGRVTLCEYEEHDSDKMNFNRYGEFYTVVMMTGK